MIYIADYFALGLVVILFMFFFDSKTTLNRMPTANKVFAAALGMTALNAIMDLVAGAMLSGNGIPLALNVLVNSIYFFTNLLTTTCIAFFFIVKILEHTHRRHCISCGK